MTAPEADDDASATAILAAAGAIGGAIAKATKTSAAAVAEQEEGANAAADAIVAAGPVSTASAPRFFVRNLGKLGEHHLNDYFQRFGRVVETTLVRDKKTQRPRGMAFISIQPPNGESADVMTEKLTTETHTINDVELEIQEAMAKPEKENKEPAAEGGAPKVGGGVPEPAAPEEPPPEEPVDPAAEALAKAQMEMHYLAMAINASVPDADTIPANLMSMPSVPKQPKLEAPMAKGFQKGFQKGSGKGKGFAKGGGKGGKGKRFSPY